MARYIKLFLYFNTAASNKIKKEQKRKKHTLTLYALHVQTTHATNILSKTFAFARFLPPFQRIRPTSSQHIRQILLHILLKQWFIIRMPPTQRRTRLRYVSSTPKHPQRVHLPPRLPIRAQHVKLACTHALQHILHRLRRRPRPRWLFRHYRTCSSASHASVRPPGHEEVCSQPRVPSECAELVCELLCERLHGGFGCVVGSVSGWVRDSLLRACVNYDRSAAASERVMKKRKS